MLGHLRTGLLALAVAGLLAAPWGVQAKPGEDHELRLLTNVPSPEGREIESDLAFWGKYAFQGGYDGFRILDIASARNPRVVADVACSGSQHDVGVWWPLLFVSVDRPQTKPECDSRNTPLNAPGWEGIRIFDVSDPTSPRFVAGVATDCGSHTHTVIPEPENGRVLLYVSSYPLTGQGVSQEWGNACVWPHNKISVVEVPLDAPETASVVAEPVFPLTPFAGPGSGCHDIGVLLDRNLGAAACLGDALILDITDRLNPAVIHIVNDPRVSIYHSGAFTWDGEVAIFGDESGGGMGPSCMESDDPTGRIWFHDVATGALLGSFKAPRDQTASENCTAHNYNVLKLEDRYVLVASWYQGGVNVLDFTDPANPRELAYYDPPAIDPLVPVLGGSWSAYWYNGYVFSSDITLGMDVFELTPKLRVPREAYLNPQTQEGSV